MLKSKKYCNSPFLLSNAQVFVWKKNVAKTYNVPEKRRIIIDKAISAMIIEKMDSSAALYSELVIVNPMIPSGCLELFAVVAIIEFTTCFHEFQNRNLWIFSPRYIRVFYESFLYQISNRDSFLSDTCHLGSFLFRPKLAWFDSLAMFMKGIFLLQLRQ